MFTRALVDKVIVEDGQARGVSFHHRGEARTVRARREVILSAGAVASPAILERSGVGDGECLRKLGIPVVRHLPGVGANLQDHLQLRPIYKVSNVPTMNTLYKSLVRRGMMGLEYLLFRRGALTMAPSQLGAFTRSSPEHKTPNLQFHIQPLSLDKFGDSMHDFPAITVSVCNLRPVSRGSVHIRSASADDAPIIAPNYLSTDEDRLVAAQSIRCARTIMRQPVLSKYKPEEFRPGAHLEGDDELARVAGDIGTTIFHPVGTARMGAAGDEMAVVDGSLRLFSIAGLRIVDASVMPTITSGNTNSPTVMIAEKAAAAILAEAAR